MQMSVRQQQSVEAIIPARNRNARWRRMFEHGVSRWAAMIDRKAWRADLAHAASDNSLWRRPCRCT
jgi:hypothetical protein